MQTKRFENGDSKIFKMKKRDRFYKLHDSYHKASLKLIGQFSVNNNINGELVHEDDMDFGVLENDNVDDDFDEQSDYDEDEFVSEMVMEQEYNYESFVFDRGR